MKEKQSKNQTPTGLTNDDVDADKMEDGIESSGIGKIDVERNDSPNMETVLPDHGKDKASLFSMASLMRPSVTSSSSVTPKPAMLTGSSPTVAEVTPSLGNIATLASGFLQNGLNITNGIK